MTPDHVSEVGEELLHSALWRKCAVPGEAAFSKPCILRAYEAGTLTCHSCGCELFRVLPECHRLQQLVVLLCVPWPENPQADSLHSSTLSCYRFSRLSCFAERLEAAELDVRSIRFYWCPSKFGVRWSWPT